MKVHIPHFDSIKTRAHKRLSKESEHELIYTANTYDQLNYETLIQFGVGIVNQWGKDWLLLPYNTGAQLYRRENNQKVISQLKGSKPSESFFEAPLTEKKETLIIAKSPRESMLLHQLLGNKANVIGFCSGEKSEMSKKQEMYLERQFSNTSNTYIFFDTDNSNSIQIAMSMTNNISNIINTTAKYIDNSEFSNSKYKDVTDAIIEGETSEYIDKIMQSAKVPALQSCITQISELDTDKNSKFPSSIYKDLPEILQVLFPPIEEGYKKDIFLLSALTVTASHLINVSFQYSDRYYTPDFYTLIVARAASGKGFAYRAKELGKPLDSYLKNNVIGSIDMKKGGTVSLASRGLYLPANSSDRAIYDGLNHNNGRGTIFETEIDTLLKANSQDWGNFSDLLRKAFHHESLSINRKDDFFSIEKPSLSLVLTGTQDQFRQLFRNSENGLYSRFSIYTFDAPNEWQSQKPSSKTEKFNSLLEKTGEHLLEIYKTLERREHELVVSFTDEQWERHNSYFSELVQQFNANEYPPILSSCLNRAGIVAARISTILSLLRLNEENPEDLESKSRLTVQDKDFEIAMSIVRTMLEHSVYLFFNELNKNSTSQCNASTLTLHNSLPESFTTEIAISIANDIGIKRRSTFRYLDELIKNSMLNKVDHGKYEKITKSQILNLAG